MTGILQQKKIGITFAYSLIFLVSLAGKLDMIDVKEGVFNTTLKNSDLVFAEI